MPRLDAYFTQDTRIDRKTYGTKVLRTTPRHFAYYICMNFDDLGKEMRTIPSGRVTVVSYSGLKFARERGIDIISDYAEMYTCQRLIADVDTSAEKLRLKETILAMRWSTEIMSAEG